LVLITMLISETYYCAKAWIRTLLPLRGRKEPYESCKSSAKPFNGYFPGSRREYLGFIRLVLKYADTVCFTVCPYLDNPGELGSSIWSCLSDSVLDYGFALAAAGKLQKKPGGAGAEESQGGAGQPAAPEAPSPYGQGTSPGNAEERGWGKDAQGWYYVKADGRKAAAEWLTLEGKEYWIEGNAYMATGWKKFPGEKWCYFGTSGALAKNTWVTSSGKWYYVGPDGVMLASTTTPDGYPVGSDGAWIQ